MWDIDSKLKRSHRDWDSVNLLQDGKKTFLESVERYDTGTTLYYIPIVPLYRMLQDRKRKRMAQLLLSVCSYLYHIADIPYYRQQDSYQYWMYEMHKDWVEQDEEQEEMEVYKREFVKADLIGDIMEQKIFNRINLEFFVQRLNRFQSCDVFDEECQKVACHALALLTEYPTASIFRNAPMPEQDPYMDDYEKETIGMEKYISFIADTKGWLYESLTDSINNEFNEYSAIEEPIIRKSFDGKEVTASDLEFENRLFVLLDELCAVLNNYKTTG